MPTFADDLLETKPFSDKLEQYLIIEHDFVDGGLVVSLNAPFGSGKTTLIEMWKNDLTERRKTDDSLPLPIVLNAWESDYCGDPLVAILAAFTTAIESTKGGKPKGKKIREAAKDIGWLLLGAGNKAVSHLTGIDIAEVAQGAQEKNEKRNEKPDILKAFEQRTDALASIKAVLRETFAGETPKALVFVDELDRCRPDFAVSYLETIKHVFDIHGIVFVLAVDYAQLESSARALFGQGLNFPEYFRKFVHRSFTLPRPNEPALRKLTEHYVTRFLIKEGKRVPKIDNVSDRVENAVALLAALKSNPRQLQEIFRICGHLLGGKVKERARLHPCYPDAGILLSALKVVNGNLYQAIGNRAVSQEEFGRYLITSMDEENAEFWFCIYLSGSTDGKTTKLDSLADAYRKSGFSRRTDEEFLNTLANFSAGWGGTRAQQLFRIYERIETAATFGA